MYADPDAGGGKLLIKEGMIIRLTRNLDKERGFSNGAVGIVTSILTENRVFVLRLFSTGGLILVHPIHDPAIERSFIPAQYGYAITTRPALGNYHLRLNIR